VSSFLMNDGDIDFPEGWEDRSIQVLSYPAGSKEPSASLSVTRHRLDGDRDLSAYIDRQLGDMIKACPRFSLIRRDPVTLGGEPAERLLFSWCSQNGEMLLQEQTAALLPAGFILVFTATASKEGFPLYAKTLRTLVDSFRLRRESP
jgi:hypothetical protein